MKHDVDVGVLYRGAREQLSELVRTLSDSQLATPVPACPGWTVHGVVSHLAGIATDAVSGRLGGIPTDEHTAQQVAERAGTNTNVVLREWERSASQFEIVLSRAGNTFLPPVLDVTVHEHDIRGALELPGNREGEVIDLAVRHIGERFVRRAASASLDDAVVIDEEGNVVAGKAGAPVRLTMSRFELFRAGFGRRSSRQIAARISGADPEPYVEQLVIFDPAPTDIVE